MTTQTDAERTAAANAAAARATIDRARQGDDDTVAAMLRSARDSARGDHDALYAAAQTLRTAVARSIGDLEARELDAAFLDVDQAAARYRSAFAAWCESRVMYGELANILRGRGRADLVEA